PFPDHDLFAARRTFHAPAGHVVLGVEHPPTVGIGTRHANRHDRSRWLEEGRSPKASLQAALGPRWAARNMDTVGRAVNQKTRDFLCGLKRTRTSRGDPLTLPDAGSYIISVIRRTPNSVAFRALNLSQPTDPGLTNIPFLL